MSILIPPIERRTEDMQSADYRIRRSESFWCAYYIVEKGVKKFAGFKYTSFENMATTRQAYQLQVFKEAIITF